MKVLVVSDHSLIAHSFVSMLHNVDLPAGATIEATLCEVGTALDHVMNASPDVALVEASIDFLAGLETVQLLRSARADLRIVVLGTDSGDAALFEAVCAGANGYVAKDTSTDTLLATLCGVARGELGLSRVAAMRLVDLLRDPGRPTPVGIPASVRLKLTKREMEVFDLVRHGLRSREIASRLCIAEATVNKHIQNVLSKLQVHSRAQALAAFDTSFLASPPAGPVRQLTHLRRPEVQALRAAR